MTRPIDVQARYWRFMMAVTSNPGGPEYAISDQVQQEIKKDLMASGKRNSEIICAIFDEAMKRLNWEG